MSKRSRDPFYSFKTFLGYDSINPKEIQNVTTLPPILHRYNPEIELWPVKITCDQEITYYFDSEFLVNKFIQEINPLRC